MSRRFALNFTFAIIVAGSGLFLAAAYVAVMKPPRANLTDLYAPEVTAHIQQQMKDRYNLMVYTGTAVPTWYLDGAFTFGDDAIVVHHGGDTYFTCEHNKTIKYFDDKERITAHCA